MCPFRWFQKYLPQARLLAAPNLQPRFPLNLSAANVHFIKEEAESELQDAQLIVSCGGDGTLLHISSIFQNGPCPPVLSFSLGSLGFLSSFGKQLFLQIYNKLSIL